MEILAKIYVQPLGRIRLWIFLLVVAWTAGRYFFGNRHWWKIGNAIGMTISVYGIVFFTVLHRGTESIEPAMFIPFHSSIEAQTQPEKYREMLMNVFLFVPFGLTVPNVLSRLKRLWPVIITVVSALLLSAAIEFAQYYFHLGRCEADDVIMNTLGTAIGASSYVVAWNMKKSVEKMKELSKHTGAIVSLSFDDGRKDFFDAYQNILKPRCIPATLNIPTGCVDGSCDTRLAKCGEESLSVKEVELLAADGNIEVASHSDRHCNEIADAIISLEKIQTWFGAGDYGFASPGSGLPEEEFLLPEWEIFSYMRSGPIFRSSRKLRFFARKVARVFHAPKLYAFAYQDCIMKNCDRIVYSVPVLKSVRFEEVRALVESAIRQGGSIILMFHGIVEDTGGHDNWVWSSSKMKMLCDYLVEQKKNGRIHLCTTKEMVSELQDRRKSGKG